MGLLGMLAAGGAIGASNAANENVKARNMLEIENAREALRQKYLDRRYQQERSDNIEMAKSKALLDQTVYERNRADKLQDEEIKHGRSKEIEGIKDSRANAANAARLEAARIRTGGGNTTGESGFSPKSPEGKAALDLLDSGRVKTLDEGYDEVNRMKLMHGLTTNQFLEPNKIFDLFDTYNSQRRSRQGQSAPVQSDAAPTVIRTFNPKTGRIE